jgi:hypothetical protein
MSDRRRPVLAAMSVRDAGEVLHVTGQRVQQLASEAGRKA